MVKISRFSDTSKDDKVPDIPVDGVVHTPDVVVERAAGKGGWRSHPNGNHLGIQASDDLLDLPTKKRPHLCLRRGLVLVVGLQVAQLRRQLQALEHCVGVLKVFDQRERFINPLHHRGAGKYIVVPEQFHVSNWSILLGLLVITMLFFIRDILWLHRISSKFSTTKKGQKIWILEVNTSENSLC